MFWNSAWLSAISWHSEGFMWRVSPGPVLRTISWSLSQAEGCQLSPVTPYSPKPVVPHPSKNEGEGSPSVSHGATWRQAADPLFCKPGTIISYLPKEQGGLLACHIGQGDTVLAGGGVMLLSPVPSEKPDFHCHNHLSFLPGTGRKLTVRTASLDFALTLCLCGKKNQTTKWA